MKHMMYMMYMMYMMAVMFVSALTFGQAKPTPTFTPEQKVQVLTAQHRLDVVEKQITQVTAQLNQAVAQSPQGRQLQDLQAQQQQLKTQLETEKLNALVSSQVDESKFDTDWETFIVRPKPTQAQAASPPEKK
jgi:hypothetical protein